MPDQTAAERAAQVLAYVRFAWQRGDIADTVFRSEQAAQVAVLMADPDLLVDLAIEAGGLTPDTVFHTYTAEDGTRKLARGEHPDRRREANDDA